MSRSVVSTLYRIARIVRTLEVIASGNPARILRRLANLFIGRRIVSHLWLRPRRHRRIGKLQS